MKPQRISMAHDLILGYGLHEHMDVYVRRAWPEGSCHRQGRSHRLAALC